MQMLADIQESLAATHVTLEVVPFLLCFSELELEAPSLRDGANQAIEFVQDCGDGQEECLHDVSN